MQPFIQELKEHDPVRLFAAVEHLPYSLLLDSADQAHRDARYSFIVSHPIETLEAKNGVLTITNWDGQTTETADPFKTLQTRLKHWRDNVQSVRGLPPFQGGAAGLFGYDLGRGIETIPNTAKDNPEMPDMAIGIYDQVIAFDHEKRQAWIITHADSYDDARRKQEYLLSLMSTATPIPKQTATPLNWQANFTRFEFQNRIQRVIDYIRAGDIFQANLAQRFDALLPEGFSPFAHYCTLRKTNPAPFATYFNLGDIQISSASPERFLTVKDRQVETRPIKGTKPVSTDNVLNLQNIKALQDSEKDRAENTMIVDLLRNDISKVCTAKSVTVSALCETETFASVHHLVSTIRGTLKKNKTAIDLLKACFPGGSITGAPKIRSMEIIEELEPTRRGPYCGSMGYIGFDGTMDTNILIRTLVFENKHVSLQSGGGIVVDSVPEAEYQETLDKAEAMFRSFETGSTETHPSNENTSDQSLTG